MTFCEKVIFLVLIFVMIKNISCYPQTKFKSYSKEKSPTNTNFISQRSCQTLNSEPIFKMFNFPEMEYSQASNNPFDFPENYKLTSLRTKLSSSSYSERNFNVKCNNMDKEFSSAPSYRDFGKFSEVEYPLTANEMWKPNYWNTPNSMNTFCQKQPTINSKLNYTSTRNGLTNNYKKYCLPESVLSFSTKSYSDPKKNYMMLKNKQMNNNITTLSTNNETVLKNKDSTCVKNNYELQKLNKDESLSTYVDKCKKPVSGIEGLHRTTDFSDVCNNSDKFASDYETKFKHSENSYANKFYEETSPIIKFVADNIVLSNSKCSKEKDSRKEIETDDIDSPKSYTEDNSLNMFNPTLENTENLVQLYADEFNRKMTAIIKSAADKCFSQNTKIPIMNYDLQSFNQGIKDFEQDYENKIKLCGDSIDSYTDRFNDEMTSALNAKFHDMFFGNLQCPKEIDGYKEYLLDENYPDSFCQVKQNYPLEEINANINNTHQKSNSSIVCIENVNVNENRITYKENILLLEKSASGLKNEKQENNDELKDDTFFSNEEFTTDAYPESDNPLSFYALSTVAPTKSILDSNIIEPEKSLYPDELEQYFMLVE